VRSAGKMVDPGTADRLEDVIEIERAQVTMP
jgi:hypothetical protein